MDDVPAPELRPTGELLQQLLEADSLSAASRFLGVTTDLVQVAASIEDEGRHVNAVTTGAQAAISVAAGS